MFEYKCTLDRVVDGDTIDVNIDLGFDIVLQSQRIRLIGIDTPETRTKNLREKKFGILAKNRVEELLKNSRCLVFVSKEYKNSGKFGRILGDIFYDGMSLCETLLDEDLAIEYAGQSKEDLIADHEVNFKILESKES